MNSSVTPDNPEAIRKVLEGWVQHNSQKIPAIADLGYGWEPWLQADLGYYIWAYLGVKGVKVEREKGNYTDKRRVDLSIGSSNNVWHHFEFKCKSNLQKKERFLEGLVEDWIKLEGIVVNRNSARAWAVGMWVDDNEGKPTLNDRNGQNLLTNWDFYRWDGINVLLRTGYKGTDFRGADFEKKNYMNPGNPRAKM